MPDAAPITFDAFMTDPALLGPWHAGEEAWKRDDAVAFTSPREAAARAAYAATVEHRGKRGLVLVLATDQASARECRGFLEAFFEQKLLAPLVKRIAPDGIELRGGMVIEVSTNDKRLVRDALCVIQLQPDADPLDTFTPLEHPHDLHFARLIMHIFSDAHHTGRDLTNEELSIARLLSPDGDAQTFVDELVEGWRKEAERLKAKPERRSPEPYERHMPLTSVPTCPRQPEREGLYFSRDDYLASREFEQKRAEEIGLRELYEGGGFLERARHGRRHE